MRITERCVEIEHRWEPSIHNRNDVLVTSQATPFVAFLSPPFEVNGIESCSSWSFARGNRLGWR